MTERKKNDAADEASKESFPASDPPAHSGITGVGSRPDGKPRAAPTLEKRTQDERPTEVPPRGGRT